MQITVNNDFNTFGGFTQQQINSFLADEQTAINILDATFTNNISVVYDVGFGSYRGQIMPNQNISEADVNENAVFFRTYSQLRQDLLNLGQPNFFTAANLPAGNSINGVTNFWVSYRRLRRHRHPIHPRRAAGVRLPPRVRACHGPRSGDHPGRRFRA